MNEEKSGTEVNGDPSPSSTRARVACSPKTSRRDHGGSNTNDNPSSLSLSPASDIQSGEIGERVMALSEFFELRVMDLMECMNK